MDCERPVGGRSGERPLVGWAAMSRAEAGHGLGWVSGHAELGCVPIVGPEGSGPRRVIIGWAEATGRTGLAHSTGRIARENGLQLAHPLLWVHALWWVSGGSLARPDRRGKRTKVRARPAVTTPRTNGLQVITRVFSRLQNHRIILLKPISPGFLGVDPDAANFRARHRHALRTAGGARGGAPLRGYVGGG